MADNDKDILERLIGGVKEVSDPSNQERLQKRVSDLKESEKKTDQPHPAARSKAPIGVDVGTSRIVSMQRGLGGEFITKDQLNSFFSVPYSAIANDMLEKNGMKFVKKDNNLVIYGYDAQNVANIFNGEVQRPMKQGLLKSEESLAIPIIKEIIGLVVGKPSEFGAKLTFSIPAPQAGHESDLVFHEAVLKKHFVGLGYNAKSLTEGTAIVLSELAENNYTGIGISMGGGMCNVCFAFLSVPVIVFSIGKGGDDIDLSVARICTERANRIRQIKEEEMDLSKAPSNKMENAFHIFHEDLVLSLLSHLSGILSQANNVPKISRSVPIVIGGGTCMPTGFKVLFEKVLKQVSLPLAISEVKVAADPLRATARGVLLDASV